MWLPFVWFVSFVVNQSDCSPTRGSTTEDTENTEREKSKCKWFSILNMTAVRRCGIQISSEKAQTGDFWGDKVGMKVATNITLQLAPNFTIHWPRVLIYPAEENHFGLFDYSTLQAGHAVIDTQQKTITMTQGD